MSSDEATEKVYLSKEEQKRLKKQKMDKKRKLEEFEENQSEESEEEESPSKKRKLNDESIDFLEESAEEENGDSDIEPEGAETKKTTSKCTGTVKFFNSEKGYGFICNDDGGADLFVHQSSLHCEGFRSLIEDEKVEFDIEKQDNGKFRAINVTGPDGAYCKVNEDRSRSNGRGRGGRRGRGGGRRGGGGYGGRDGKRGGRGRSGGRGRRDRY